MAIKRIGIMGLAIIIFITLVNPADQCAPENIIVTSWEPKNDNVSVDGDVTITFNVPINISTIDLAFYITPGIAGTKTWTNDNTTLTWSHTEDFAKDTTYTVTLFKSTLRSVEGLELAEDFEWSFITIEDGIGPMKYPLIIPVMDEDKKPVSDAEVTIKIGDKTFVGKTKDGFVTFQLTEEEYIFGNWTVKVTKDGYQDLEFKIQLGIQGEPGNVPPLKKKAEEPVIDQDKEKSGTFLDPMAIMAIIIVIILSVVMPIIIIIVALYLSKRKKQPPQPPYDDYYNQQPRYNDYRRKKRI